MGSGIDSITRSRVTVSYEHNEVHDGGHFHIGHSVEDLGAVASPVDLITLSFLTPNTPKLIHTRIAGISSQGALFRVIRGRTGGGTGATGTLEALNSNEDLGGVSAIRALDGTLGHMSLGATIFTGGASILDEYLGADGIGTAFTGGSSRGDEEIVLKRGTYYQISLFSTANAPGTLKMSWYEHTNQGRG